ncbi:DUF3533 domain-containing protein [Kitasatospora cineracea]|uniref:DUF3533 domain-containing protein n=1 Tax=Kitasatospora cineracea TaxID=88074 RepID=UPI0037A2B56A
MATRAPDPSPQGPRPMRLLRDAVTPRAALVMFGVLLLQLGFALSYMGAFHDPKPHGLRVAVVAPPAVQQQAVAKLDALPGDPVDASPAADEAQARQLLLDRGTDAAALIDPARDRDTLLVASAAGTSVSDTAARIAQTIEQTQGRQVTVQDVRPPAKGDSRGLSSFYLVLSWTIGGYLAASALNMVSGSPRPAPARTAVRLAAMLPYAFVSGIGGALIVGPLLSCLPGAFWELTGIGTLVVFASGVVGVAMQRLLGTIGLGLTIVLFTILGNPSSGGVYPAALLPPFWRAIGQALPPGAGTTVVRNTVYFDGAATAGAVWVLIAWTAGGILVALAASFLLPARPAIAASTGPAPDAV